MAIEQAAAIPCRVSRRNEVSVLLVSTGGGQWGLPKGHVEDGEEHHETAQREALEEAGIIGKIVLPHVGRFMYVRDGRQHRVQVYSMIVHELLSDWQEKGRRRRAWVTLREAQRLVGRPGFRQMLRMVDLTSIGVEALRKAV